jgi:hypothetical protein
MDLDEFWRVVGVCRRVAGVQADFNVALTRELEARSVADIADFRLRWLAASDGLYTWDVWDASTLMLGGTDDDSFVDFRSWVISLGRVDYDLIRDDPDNLARYGRVIADAESPAAEQLNGIPTQLYLARTQQYPPNPPDDSVLTQPLGNRTDLSDRESVRARFPRIYAWRTQAAG